MQTVSKIFVLLLFTIDVYAADILVLEDNGTQDSVYAIFDRAGISVDSGGAYWQFTGEDLDEYEVIIFLNGVNWTNDLADSAHMGQGANDTSVGGHQGPQACPPCGGGARRSADDGPTPCRSE